MQIQLGHSKSHEQYFFEPKFIGIVIILTLLTACSEIPFLKDSHQSSDPVAEAALQVRKSRSARLGQLGRHLSSGIMGPGRPDPNPVELAKAIQKGIFEGELVPGMSSNDVAQAWGKPHQIQYAGDPSIRNEKWIYTDRPTQEGKMLPVKVVYFEEGRVAGWKTSFEVSDPVSGPPPPNSGSEP